MQRIEQHVQSFYVIACMKQVLSMPLWLMNRNVFIEKHIQREFPIVIARFACCNWSVTLVTQQV